MRTTKQQRQVREAKQRVFALANGFGAILDMMKDGTITVDAPSGFVWSCAQVHHLEFQPEGAYTQDHLWQDALERMRMGIEPCPIELDPMRGECHGCAEARDQERRLKRSMR